ncbi:hypothetical protein [Oecophyllibacter saccharovorans]|uniref:hypothetical protein n=1 Tax=Oecophyllibacter saccharovorans TaxID=2558360 RepID=UPI00116F5EF8|nr:hypothetical protein [Oecophyllibacter saccharovorans]TPW36511.1 hypothetical protein E3203_01710 [Oecophyllibacter saccharovorans]
MKHGTEPQTGADHKAAEFGLPQLHSQASRQVRLSPGELGGLARAAGLAVALGLGSGVAANAQPVTAQPAKTLQQLVASSPAPMPTGPVSTEHPRLTPERDVKVVYRFRTSPQPAGPMKEVTVWFSADGDKLRIEPSSGEAVTLLDRPAQRVTLMSLREKSYIQFLPLHGLRNPFLLDLTMHYTREGMGNVAGQPCRNWAITSPRGRAEACVTEDGVILSEKGVDADGITGELEAVQVTYGPIPSAEFAPPADFRQIQPHARPVPMGAPGTGMGGGVQGQMPAPVDTSQPPVANDSAGDGTVQHADQPR